MRSVRGGVLSDITPNHPRRLAFRRRYFHHLFPSSLSSSSSSSSSSSPPSCPPPPRQITEGTFAYTSGVMKSDSSYSKKDVEEYDPFTNAYSFINHPYNAQ
jgi:hypothetical protein